MRNTQKPAKHDGHSGGFTVNLQGMTFIIVVILAMSYVYTTWIDKPGASGGNNNLPSGGGGSYVVYSGPTYTLSNASYDADTQAQIGPSAVTAFVSPSEGKKVSLSGVPIKAGTTLTVLCQASNYFSTIQTLTTPDAVVSCNQKAIDTAISFTAYDDNDRSELAAGTENLTIGNGSSAVAHLKVKQSASYTHPTGDSKIACVFVNVTSGQEGNFDPSSMAASWNGANCVEYGSTASAGLLANTVRPASSAMKGALLVGFVCQGVDFGAKDSATYLLDIKHTSASGVNPGQGNLSSATWAMADYYTDATGKLSLKPGCVTDAGVAVHTFQTKALPID